MDIRIEAEPYRQVTLMLTIDEAADLLNDFDKTHEPSRAGKQLVSALTGLKASAGRR